MVRYLKSHGASKEYNPDTTTIHQLAEEALKLNLKKYDLHEVLEAKFPDVEMQKTMGKFLIFEEIFEWESQQEKDPAQEQKTSKVLAYIVPRLRPLFHKVYALQKAKKE